MFVPNAQEVSKICVYLPFMNLPNSLFSKNTPNCVCATGGRDHSLAVWVWLILYFFKCIRVFIANFDRISSIAVLMYLLLFSNLRSWISLGERVLRFSKHFMKGNDSNFYLGSPMGCLYWHAVWTVLWLTSVVDQKCLELQSPKNNKCPWKTYTKFVKISIHFL